MTRWLDPQPVEIPAFFKTLRLGSGQPLPPLVVQTLLRRGISRPEDVEAFLHPDTISSTPFPHIEKATDIIRLSIRNGDRICVWGDFDVDGQTSTALLVQTLQAMGADVVYYIPVRGKESHGVHIESLEPILDAGTKLLLTCDTGITAHPAVEYCNSRGVDVIITDHHDLGETLPNAKAVINPKMLTDDHPLRHLAGVGVAYKLAEALLNSEVRSQMSDIKSTDLLDLVALGLIADVALLKGETRALAKKGIQRLRETARLGLRAMADLAGASLETLTEETIGFTFAPRLNALGRLSDANPAVELLITNNPPRARVIAAQIEGLNAQRRLLTSQIHEAAEAQLRENPEWLTEPVIVLSRPNWPGGVIGIVANRLADRYHKPAVLLAEDESGVLRGSARSIEGLHITEAIAANKELLLSFGGHPMAAGLSLLKENLPAFRRGLGKAIERQLGEIIREEPSLQIDAWLGLDQISPFLADSLELLAPFGAGNPPLTLATRGVKIKSVAEIGKGKEHLRLTVEDRDGNVQNILWWGGAGEELPDGGSTFDIAYSLRASTFRGQKQVNLIFGEIRLAAEKPIEIPKPKMEVRDMRRQPVLLNLQPSSLIWAEGPDRAAGVPRFELRPAEEFSIYTTPASPADLRRALEIVKPKTVYVFGVSPAEEKPDEFLSHLAGLCKYVVNQRRGKVVLQELAAAMATRESAVRIGLEWLAAGGHLTVSAEEDALLLSRGNGEANPYLQKELYVAVKGILAETAAYRAYFATADIQRLMEWE
ncbi:MAG: single-stranded-DNA-specific exonuclease RecJ [Chloroflexi bacterium]|nr:single-stranded-DNA-specific exonuclease RecJ [Chloroflexota bacterium]